MSNNITVQEAKEGLESIGMWMDARYNSRFVGTPIQTWDMPRKEKGFFTVYAMNLVLESDGFECLAGQKREDVETFIALLSRLGVVEYTVDMGFAFSSLINAPRICECGSVPNGSRCGPGSSRPPDFDDERPSRFAHAVTASEGLERAVRRTLGCNAPAGQAGPAKSAAGEILRRLRRGFFHTAFHLCRTTEDPKGACARCASCLEDDACKSLKPVNRHPQHKTSTVLLLG